MLKVEGLCKDYGNGKGVTDISFQVASGKVCAILGSNGCGKTTTFRLLLQLLQKDRGKIYYNKEELKKEEYRLFGYVPEERSMLRNLKVEEHLQYLGRLKKMEEEEIEESMQYWLSFFHVEAYRHTKIMELSKGNQQKIQMICALLHDPSILIFDEPLNGLDVVNVSLFKELLDLLKKKKKTVLISSHQYQNIERYCDQVVYLQSGRVLFKGDVWKLKSKKPERYVYLHTRKNSYAKEKSVLDSHREKDYLIMRVKDKESAYQIVQKAMSDEVEDFKVEMVSLQDIIQEKTA